MLIAATGPHGNLLKVRPPLIFRPEHAARAVAALDRALARAA